MPQGLPGDHPSLGYIAARDHEPGIPIEKRGTMLGRHKVITTDEGGQHVLKVEWVGAEANWLHSPTLRESVQEGFATNPDAGPREIGAWSMATPAVKTTDVGTLPLWGFRHQDGRFESLDDVTAQTGPPPEEGRRAYRVADGGELPAGIPMLLAAGFREEAQEVLAFPLRPIIADHRGGSQGKFSSICYDIDGDAIDNAKAGGEHSWRYIQQSLATFYEPMWMVTRAADGTGYGACVGQPDGAVTTGPAGDPAANQPLIAIGDPGLHNAVGIGGAQNVANPNVPGPQVLRNAPASKLGVMLTSYERRGPFHPGHENDKHKLGETEDEKWPVNPTHIWTEALYYCDRIYDGPLEFQCRDWRPGAKLPVRVAVDLQYDQVTQMWRWISYKDSFTAIPPFRPPDDPIETPPAKPPHEPIELIPGVPMRPTWFPTEIAAPSFEFTAIRRKDAQPYDDRHDGAQDEEEFAQRQEERRTQTGGDPPRTIHLQGFGKDSGGTWDKHRTGVWEDPKESTSYHGTSDGGLWITPPDLFIDGTAPSSLPDTAFVFYSGLFDGSALGNPLKMGFGTASQTAGALVDGWYFTAGDGAGGAVASDAVEAEMYFVDSSGAAREGIFTVNGHVHIDANTSTDYWIDADGEDAWGRMGELAFGAFPYDAGAFVGNAALDHVTGPSNYALLQGSTGNTQLNAPSGKTVTIATGATERARFSDAWARFTGSVIGTATGNIGMGTHTDTAVTDAGTNLITVGTDTQVQFLTFAEKVGGYTYNIDLDTTNAVHGNVVNINLNLAIDTGPGNTTTVLIRNGSGGSTLATITNSASGAILRDATCYFDGTNWRIKSLVATLV